jgi:hypothetical protein
MAKKLAGVPILSLALFLLGGCAVSTQVTNTPRSSIEQQLLMRSLERALTAPSLTVPVLGLAMPEISLFRDMRHSGRTELQVYTIDADTGKFLNKSRTAVGAAQYDDYKILLVINFTRSDIDDGSSEPGAG